MAQDGIKIWHISDTHCLHENLEPPDDIDIVVHSGDFSNHKDSKINKLEVQLFLEWFSALDIKNKILVAGNHDVSIYRGLIKREYIENLGISYLENSSINICGFKFWGSPYTPTFGNGWAWNKPRNSINKIWNKIPEDTDILVTHGPPKGILDLTVNKSGRLESCGCASLKSKISKIRPAICMFGHVHNSLYIKNNGIIKFQGKDEGEMSKCAWFDGNTYDVEGVTYSNGVCVDLTRGKLINIHNGNTFLFFKKVNQK